MCWNRVAILVEIVRGLEAFAPGRRSGVVSPRRTADAVLRAGLPGAAIS
ncbi:MAG: hypothetical protein ABFC89_04205 [Methanospirillum sp.]